MSVRCEIINRTTDRTVTSNALLLSRAGRARGFMFRRDPPDDLAYIFRYADIGRRGVHMVFVFQPLDVVWLQQRSVEKKATLRPFVGHQSAEADAFIEFPAGGADGIRVGDTLAWGPR